MKELMVQTIRRYWYYEAGVLEKMTETEIREIYERLLDWIEE